MLILSRNEGDVIHIGDGVRIVVLSCDRKGVRLGIDAPRDVRILRGEIMVDIEQEKREWQAGAVLVGGEHGLSQGLDGRLDGGRVACLSRGRKVCHD